MAIRKYSEMTGTAESDVEIDRTMIIDHVTKRCKFAHTSEDDLRQCMQDTAESAVEIDRTMIIDHVTKRCKFLHTSEDDLRQCMQDMSTPLDNEPSTVVNTAKSQTSGSRFLDLPAEARNMIYSMAIYDHEMDHIDRHRRLRIHQDQPHDPDKRMSLGSFTIPAISRASKQLRNESLGLFFQDTEFEVIFTAHFDGPLAHGSKVTLVRFYDDSESCNLDTLRTPRKPACDSLCLEPQVGSILKNVKGCVLFRNVTFRVSEMMSYDGVVVMCGPNGDWDDQPASELTLKVNGRTGAMVKLTHTASDDWKPVYSDLFADMENAKKRAEEIASPEGFQGFTLGNLQEIATLFASTTEDGTRPVVEGCEDDNSVIWIED